MNFKPMKDYMDSLTSWRIPGNSISICIENQEVFNYSSGYADIENKIPMDCDKLLNIYSCTKPITVTAALQLYEKGFFLLDDPLYEYIPEFKDMYVKNADGQIVKSDSHITLRQVFTMTSGITYENRKVLYEEAREKNGGKLETMDVIKCIAKDYLASQPGKIWRYSSNHDVLAGVVEVISGKKFRDYVDENIFKPLGIKDAHFDNENVRNRMAEQYKYQINTDKNIVDLQSGASSETGTIVNCGKANGYVLDRCHDSGGAGLTMSVNEYSLFASALANGGVGKTRERILASSTIELMRTNQLNSEQLNGIVWPQLKGYGYGLGVRTLIDKAKSGSTGNLGEFGWSGAAGATLLVDPDLKLSMFYAHHMINCQETYYMPRLRNALYTCINS